MLAISTTNLSKTFTPRVPRTRPWNLRRPGLGDERAADTTVALDRLSIRVQPGECYGLLGPNGAGKTTTARMLATLLEPTSGAASVAGFDITREARDVRRRVGVMFAGERGLYWRLTGRENLQLFARLQYMPGRLIAARIRYLEERLGLANRTHELVETYSTGMKQRLNLARVLLHDPPTLLLDEPTAALDPSAARATRDLIRELRDAAKGVLLTTHNMHEAEEVCDRVGILHRGVLVAEGTPDELIQTAGLEPRLELRIAGEPEAARRRLQSSLLWWESDPDGGGGRASIRASRGWETARDAVEQLKQVGAAVIDTRLREATLEDAFIELTGSRLGGAFDEV